MSGGPESEGAGLPVRRAEAILAHLEADAAIEVTEEVRAALIRAKPAEVLDLWERQEAAVTYWILLLTGVNRAEEVAIAKDLLAWQAFFAKDSARVLCVQSSERGAFRCCARAFGARNFPTLIVGDSPLMVEHAKAEADLLDLLANKPGGLQNFFTKIHVELEMGMSLNDLRRSMAAETFWKGVGDVYKEAKDLFSFTLAAGGR